MGVRKVGGNHGEFGRKGILSDSLGASRSTSPGSTSSGVGNLHGLGDSEYISVYQEGKDALPEGEYPEGYLGDDHNH